jgi:hypothetical protein
MMRVARSNLRPQLAGYQRERDSFDIWLAALTLNSSPQSERGEHGLSQGRATLALNLGSVPRP